MTEKKLDEILFVVKGLEDKIKWISKKLNDLSTVNLKGEAFHKKPESQETFKIEIKNTMVETKSGSDYMIPMGKGKYQWYKLKDDNTIKLRKCKNEGCLLFLKWNDTKKKYEHWKYDANTGEGGFVQDGCDYYGGS